MRFPQLFAILVAILAFIWSLWSYRDQETPHNRPENIYEVSVEAARNELREIIRVVRDEITDSCPKSVSLSTALSGKVYLGRDVCATSPGDEADAFSSILTEISLILVSPWRYDPEIYHNYSVARKITKQNENGYQLRFFEHGPAGLAAVTVRNASAIVMNTPNPNQMLTLEQKIITLENNTSLDDALGVVATILLHELCHLVSSNINDAEIWIEDIPFGINWARSRYLFPAILRNEWALEVELDPAYLVAYDDFGCRLLVELWNDTALSRFDPLLNAHSITLAILSIWAQKKWPHLEFVPTTLTQDGIVRHRTLQSTYQF